MDRLQAMRVFIAVVDASGLSAAAKTLGMSLPTVSRVLSTLERDLGVRLLVRSTRDLTQTDAGRVYYRRCRQILDDVRQGDLDVQSHARVPTGELRITAPVTFGRYHVAPLVTEFLERHSQLSSYLLLSDECESLAEQRLDVAVRIAVLREQSVTARRLGYIQRAVVGSAEYFRHNPVPRHPRELTQHNCLHFTHYLRADDWNFYDQGRKLSVKVAGRTRANNQEALADAVLAGAGLAVLPTWLVKAALESGRMRRVLVEFEAPGTPVYAVFPTRGAPPGKVRAFVDFVGERYREEAILAADPARLHSQRSPASTR